MNKRLLVVLPILILLAVGLYFVFATSPNVRYWADDFCTAAQLNRIGLLDTQISIWNSWTGRFSATFAISFFELIGPWVVRILPILLLGLLIFSLKRFYKVSRIVPTLFIFLVLINAPNIIQSFYWQTGSLNYLAPFVFLNIFLSFVLFPSKKTKIFLPALFLLAAGGFSEAFALAQIVLVAFIYLAVKLTTFPKKEERLRIIISGIIGAVVSLVIISLAPGNTARALSVTQPSDMIFVIKSTVLGTKWYLLRMLSIKPFTYSLFLLFTAILVLVKRVSLKTRDSLTLGGVSILAAILTITAVIFSGFYSMSVIPPERTLLIAIYMILVCFAAFSIVVSGFLKPKSNIVWAVIVLNLVTSVLLVKSVVGTWSNVYSEVKTYATRWDLAEKDLPILKNITPVGGLDGFTDNKGWVASCVSGYYGLSNVKITE